MRGQNPIFAMNENEQNGDWVYHTQFCFLVSAKLLVITDVNVIEATPNVFRSFVFQRPPYFFFKIGLVTLQNFCKTYLAFFVIS
jgi:hypothetical protein